MAGLYLAGAFVIVQVVDALFPLLLIPDAVGTVVAFALVIGFPIAVILSWVFELTPGGFRRELSAEEAKEARAESRGALELRTDSVAVLPFQNLSSDPENEYFSDGITDDILSAVARIKGLRVLTRTSVARFGDTDLSLPEIAAQLGVATFVSGSVRRAGSTVRIVAEVTDARTDAHLWSETYDREMEDVFRIQSEVAASVALAVRRELSTTDRAGIESRGTRNAEAYDLYLKAHFLWNERSDPSVNESIGYFERAIEADPGFALAHAGLADALAILGVYGTKAPSEVMPAARQAAERALELQTGLSEALASLALVEAVYDWKWDAAEARFREAMAANPSYSTAPQWLAMTVLAPQARFEEARQLLSAAEEMDPASPAIAASQGVLSLYAGDAAGAVETLETLIRRTPRFGLACYFLGRAYDALGDFQRAVVHARAGVEHSQASSETLAAFARALERAGEAEEAEQVRARLEARAARRYVSPTLLALITLGRDRTGALALLEEAAERRATDLIWLGVHPAWSELREEPRFQGLLDRLGLG